MQRLLNDNGINRLSLMGPDTPTGVSLSGVGRRTSVLFKKAKNGVKLQRSPDRALENGEDQDVEGSPASPTSIEDERHSRKRPWSRSCSESEGERSPEQEEETGDPACDFSFHLSIFLLCLTASISPSQPLP